MDPVAQFVEQGKDFVVLQQRRLCRSWFGEVANKRGCGVAACSIGQGVAWLQGEVGSVTILSSTGVQIEIEVADERSALFIIIPDTEDLDIRMPRDIILAILC